MQTDLFGKKRFKVNLHTHTTLSDGRKTPQEAIEFYRERGYDALALTDHWHFGEGYDANGLTVLSGGEYNTQGNDTLKGVFHIVGIGMRRQPSMTLSDSAQKIIDEIRAAGGLAVLAHPAWSLNTPDQILPLQNVDLTEIYNGISGVHNNRRPDASLIVDMLATRGRLYPLLAVDDAHYYDTDAGIAWIMVEAEDNQPQSLLSAIKAQRFYATQGPEIHLTRENDAFAVHCSPCQEIVFFSNLVSPRAFVGDGITTARYTLKSGERFIRAAVMDRNGKYAWSNIIEV